MKISITAGKRPLEVTNVPDWKYSENFTLEIFEIQNYTYIYNSTILMTNIP